MPENSIYSDIAKRTGGDIYIGVVGPVRTGKSTFIRRFLDCVVVPNIKDENDRARTTDEIPQSASGRTVMTTEPKFVPDEAVRISVADGTELNVKMIDCVGYMVDGALGDTEDGEPRMIMTPWSEQPMSFAAAAEIGTGKVISEHSTIGILVTTDGTISDIKRESYVEKEERIVDELKKLGKPFAIILNSANPGSDEAKALAEELENKYGVSVALVSCPMLNAEDIKEILALVLKEFPITELKFSLPEWTLALPRDHKLIKNILDNISAFAQKAEKLGDLTFDSARECSLELVSLDAGDGTGYLKAPLTEQIYYETLSELTGMSVSCGRDIFEKMCELSKIKEKYEYVEAALRDVEAKGYGVVMPRIDEMALDEPTLVKQSGGYGVRLTASASSIHMIKTGIKAELCPVVGTREQSEEVIRYLCEEMSVNPDKIWQSNMFGRSLYDMVSDGMNAKLAHMPEESREKMGETLERIINEGAGGLICILL